VTTLLLDQEPIRSATKERGRALGGLLVRKECWKLSLAAKVILWAVMIAAVWGGVQLVYPFLAVTDQVHSSYLVVEAWIPRYGLQQAVKTFQTGGYTRMLISGCARFSDQDGSETPNPAYTAALQVQRYGMNSNAVTAVACPIEQRDRTYNTALAVKEWLKKNGISAESIDVLTVGPHARRSRLLFEKAFGNQTRIGVISVDDRGYDPAHWWRSSEGVRDVIGETIAYAYARIFFHP
jgi:uncharacterized SAM-binding protein YcdF (DUF218 family)